MLERHDLRPIRRSIQFILYPVAYTAPVAYLGTRWVENAGEKHTSRRFQFHINNLYNSNNATPHQIYTDVGHLTPNLTSKYNAHPCISHPRSHHVSHPGDKFKFKPKVRAHFYPRTHARFRALFGEISHQYIAYMRFS
jgi:hypothetical protein